MLLTFDVNEKFITLGFCVLSSIKSFFHQALSLSFNLKLDGFFASTRKLFSLEILKKVLLRKEKHSI